MYETESNGKTAPASEIPPEALSAFAELGGNVTARSVLPWSEHCTECVWPTCYTTCDLYEPREDLRCRRFVDGMVRVECPGGLNSYLLKIRFKQWGKLWAPGSGRLYPMEEAKRLEGRDFRIGSTLYQLPLPGPLKRTAVAKRYSFKKRVAQRSAAGEGLPTSFLLESYNPQSETIGLSLTIRSLNPNVKIPFQKLVQARAGFARTRVPYDEIASALDMGTPFSIEIIPNDVPSGTTLYFGAMDFVQEVRVPDEGGKPEVNGKKIKCVVWDLDHTLWDGVLVEDGAEKLRLKPGIVEIVKELDRRGILHSIASKNNHDEAWRVLKAFEIDQYFLCPQISWGPKGEGVKAIARELNIGLDTLLFVDDSEFELEQVRGACPDVRVVRAERYTELPGMKECQAAVTAEGAERRKLYQVEATRQAAAGEFAEDYLAFLRHCEITLNVKPLAIENLERVHELTQRTNQMNFSGNRYSREPLKEVLDTAHLDAYVLECEDRFGSYGAIGFALVDRREPRMTDLMFSCRVQSKRVEHAFLGFLIRKYTTECGKDFLANYRKTPRNAPSGAVFADLGFEDTGTADGVSRLRFPRERALPDDGIIRVRVNREDAVAAGRT